MGKVDIAAKQFFSRNDRFADAFNFLVYDGKQVVDPQALAPLDSVEIVMPYGNAAHEPKQKARDLLKLWQVKADDHAVYVVFGMENQTVVNYAMPVRCGLYDFMNYASQVEEAARSYRQNGATEEGLSPAEFLSGFRRDDKLMPVVTLVIYLGTDVWDAPMCIHDMLDTDDRCVLKFVPNYRINLIAPVQMQDGDFDKFGTDVGEVLKFIKSLNDKRQLRRIVSADEKFMQLDVDAANLIKAATGFDFRLATGEGKVNMGNALVEIREEGREEGRAEGREEMREEMRGTMRGIVQKLMDKLHMSAEEALAMLEIPADMQQEILAMM